MVPIFKEQRDAPLASLLQRLSPPLTLKLHRKWTRREFLEFTLQASAAVVVGGLIDGKIAQRDSRAAIPELALALGRNQVERSQSTKAE
jgi:hypothetical protein